MFDILKLGLLASAATIVRSIGLGWRPVVVVARLVLYSALLLPGFCQVVVYYLSSPDVLRGIAYGSGARQRVDLYMPPAAARRPGHGRAAPSRHTGRRSCAGAEAAPGRPVVIFLTGGAWMMGHRAWGCLLARRLSMAGVLVACIDYANFPLQAGDVGEMLRDVNAGIKWVVDNVAAYGGDTGRVHLVGQSAGAHLAALALVLQAAALQHERSQQRGQQRGQQQGLQDELEEELRVAQLAGLLDSHARWHPRQVRSFVGVSGVFDVLGLAAHFCSLGIRPAVFRRLMSVKGRPALRLLSPVHCLAALAAAAGDVAAAAVIDGLDVGGRGAAEQGQHVQQLLEGAAGSCCWGGAVSCTDDTSEQSGSCQLPQQAELPLPLRSCNPGAQLQPEGAAPVVHVFACRPGSPRCGSRAFATGDAPAAAPGSGICTASSQTPRRRHQHGHQRDDQQLSRSSSRPSACGAHQLPGEQQQRRQRHLLPPVTLLHGAQDRTVPCHVSMAFAEALKAGGMCPGVRLQLYQGETHTSPLVENPMRGGADALTDAILAAVTGQQHPAAATSYGQLCPEVLIRMAGAVCPF